MGFLQKPKEKQQAAVQLVPTKVDPEQPAVQSASSAPADLLDSSQHVQPDAGQRSKSAPAQRRKPQHETLTPEQQQTLEHLQRLTKVMDSAITLPIIGKKIGLDALIGLVPYAGDMAGAGVGTYIITRALKYNMPKRLVFRMLVNQAIDSMIGIIPFIGDIFDIGFKANTRNMKLLQAHLEQPKQATRADTCFLFSLFFLVVVLPVFLFLLVIVGIILGICAALGKL